MHCYQAFLCYWDGYRLKKCSEPYSAQMVPNDPSSSWTISVESPWTNSQILSTAIGPFESWVTKIIPKRVVLVFNNLLNCLLLVDILCQANAHFLEIVF